MRAERILLLAGLLVACSDFRVVGAGSPAHGLVEPNKVATREAAFPPRYPDTMCGPKCLLQIALAYGKRYTLNAVASLAGTDLGSGTTVEGMVQGANKMGLQATPVKTNIGALSNDSRVAILLLHSGDLKHFVILDRIERDRVRLLDGTQFRDFSTADLHSIWDGYAILIGAAQAHRMDCLQLYAGRGMQVSGSIILAGLLGLALWQLWLRIRLRPRRPSA